MFDSKQIPGNDLSKTEVLSELDEYNRQYYRPYYGRRKRAYRPWFGYGGWQDFNVIYKLPCSLNFTSFLFEKYFQNVVLLTNAIEPERRK